MGSHGQGFSMFPDPFSESLYSHGPHTADGVHPSAEDDYLLVEELRDTRQARVEQLIDQYGPIETINALARLPHAYQQAYVIGRDSEMDRHTAAVLLGEEDVREAIATVHWTDFLIDIARESDRQNVAPDRIINPDYSAVSVLSTCQPVGAIGRLKPDDLDLVIRHNILGHLVEDIAEQWGISVEEAGKQVKRARLLYGIAKQRFAEDPDAQQGVLNPQSQRELIMLSSMEPVFAETPAAVQAVYPEAELASDDEGVYVRRDADGPNLLKVALVEESRAVEEQVHALQFTVVGVPEGVLVSLPDPLLRMYAGSHMTEARARDAGLSGDAMLNARNAAELGEVMGLLGWLETYRSHGPGA